MCRNGLAIVNFLFTILTFRSELLHTVEKLNVIQLQNIIQLDKTYILVLKCCTVSGHLSTKTSKHFDQCGSHDT